jgi:hypothetical protein
MSNDTFLEKIKGTTTQLINISGGAVKILYNQVLGDVAASSNVLEFVKSMTAASKPSNKSTIDTSSTRPRLTLPSQDNLDIRLFSWKSILGIQSDELAEAFEQSTLRFLSLFEKHLGETNCPFILGDRPSLADFGLLGPLYAHLYKDPVPGYIMRTRYPLVAEWCERVHDWNGIRFNRSMKYDKDTGTMIDDDKDRKLEWYPDDHVPPTVIAMLSCFFDEMWPVLVSASKVLTKYINDGQGPGINIGLPGKSFGASSSSQLNDGSLTHAFTIPVYDRMGTKGRRTRYASRPIKHLSGRRMVIPYQFWMLGRIADDVTVLNRNGKAKEITTFLNKCGNNNGDIEGFMNVDKMIVAGCRIKKIGGKLFSVGPSLIGKSRL